MISLLLAAGLAIAAVIALTAALVGDATIGATVGGLFSLINTGISLYVAHKQRRVERGVRHTHRILTAPRKAVFDSDGHMVGTVLALEHDRDWTGRVIPPQRAEDFEEGDSAG